LDEMVQTKSKGGVPSNGLNMTLMLQTMLESLDLRINMGTMVTQFSSNALKLLEKKVKWGK